MIPCALITSCSGLHPNEIVKSILKVEELPESAFIVENVSSFPWHVDTKYYTADVNLCVTDSRTIGNEDFAKTVEAIIITFDTKQASSFDEVKTWLPCLEQIGSSVRVLVCDRSVDNDAVSRLSLVSWCLDNNFELVELNPIENDEGSDEDDFKESFGIQRIIEALSCHSWPNMVMKDKPSFRSPYFEQLISDTAAANRLNDIKEFQQNSGSSVTKHEGDVKTQAGSHFSTTKPSTDTDQTSHPTSNGASVQSTVLPFSSQIVDPMISETEIDEAGEDSFEKLFDKLQIMKDAASRLPPDQRKDYAKQVTLQFWKAIGGSPEEIEGLSDEDY